MKIVLVLSALAQQTRLAAMSLLVERGDEGLTVGELADRTRTFANSMSTHLAILARAGLVTARRSGRHTIYVARPDAVRELADHLVRELCHPRSEHRAEASG